MTPVKPTKASATDPGTDEPAVEPRADEPNSNETCSDTPKPVEPSSLPGDKPKNRDKKAETALSPITGGLLPGLSKSEQKKALKKAKEKKIAEEKRRETEKRKEEEKKIDNYNKNLALVKKDFMKTKALDNSSTVEEEFIFEDAPETLATSSMNASVDDPLTPLQFDSTSAKQIQKEELWRSAVENQNQKGRKRNLTPEKEAEDRKTRMKQGKGVKQH